MDAALYDEFYRIEATHWWSVGMRRVFHMLAAAAVAGRGATRLLDVGCGTGIALEEFGRYGDILGVDLAWQAVTYSKQRVPDIAVVQADLTRLPIATRSVDMVLAFDVIEHLDDDGAALREMGRVLRDGGALLLNVPAFMSLWCEKDTLNHHRRRYTKYTLREVLENNGFGIERLTYTNSTLFPLVWCVRRWQRWTRHRWSARAEYHPNPVLNRVLLGLLDIERRFLRYVDLPFGTSVTCSARWLG